MSKVKAAAVVAEPKKLYQFKTEQLKQKDTENHENKKTVSQDELFANSVVNTDNSKSFLDKNSTSSRSELDNMNFFI